MAQLDRRRSAGVDVVELLVGWKRQGQLVRGVLLSSWLLAAGLEVALFLLHPKLDGLLDSESRSIISRHEFKDLHLLYMNLSTVQWAATIVYIWATVWAWRRRDSGASLK